MRACVRVCVCVSVCARARVCDCACVCHLAKLNLQFPNIRIHQCHLDCDPRLSPMAMFRQSPVLNLKIVTRAALSSWLMLFSSVPMFRRCRHSALKLFLRMVFASLSDMGCADCLNLFPAMTDPSCKGNPNHTLSDERVNRDSYYVRMPTLHE